MNLSLQRLSILAFALLLSACATFNKSSKNTGPAPLPKEEAPVPAPSTPDTEQAETIREEELPTFAIPQREMRGVWIATVANIDWPSSGTDSFEKQQRDFIQILDFYRQHNFNAVFVQIRAAGDAFYPSKMAPWSRYLSGKEGKAPQTMLDPLKWMIQVTHERGMEFHAWLNPYRATFNLKVEDLSPMHDYFRHTDWMVKYGSKYYYNPGIPAVKDHMVNIVREVLTNYDIDGVHLDDYFYPYKIPGEAFNDQIAFKKYGNGLDLGDWRRANVDQLIQGLSDLVKNEKPWVQFGVSPFGVWRNASVDPNGSDTQAGQTNYDDLYADPLSWVKNGWVDYLAPQIYWSLDHPKASHRELVDWWAKNAGNTPIYIGNGSYKIRNDADEAWRNAYEIPNQVAIGRSKAAVEGNVYFRARSLMGSNRDIASLLSQTMYENPVLTPNKARNKVFESIEPDISNIHLSDRGLQIAIENAYLAKSVALFGLNTSGKWELVESQYTGTSIDGKTFMFDSYMVPNYPYLAIGFLGNFGEFSQVEIWKP
ncbi:family 10 glycosylhydrolase [Echinicola marina]|uniref:glycoside hydrolase family 10 protein n=1 Tax=Echinicola marina TaxID=2859768 RepID=UPI001CF6F2F3|nr:family 10 glycosylhydrolase [Echinicola marina]UCS94684.1 family 10 glycosylhydrolase [Echinicola marina]